MNCEFCEVPEGDADNPITTYVSGDDVVVCCSNCLDEKLEKGKRQVLRLPKGWQAIKDADLKHYQRNREALIAVSAVMERAEGNKPSDSYYPYPAGRLEDLFNNLNKQITKHRDFVKSIGINDRYNLTPSGAYCPECKSPLLKMVSLPVKKAIQIAASDVVKIMKESREARNKKAFVCLNCQVSYTSNAKE